MTKRQKNLPSHRKVIHIILSQNTLCKRLFTHIRELLAPPNTIYIYIYMCKRANFNMYRVVVSAYLYIFENSWPNRILYVCLYFRWRCSESLGVGVGVGNRRWHHQTIRCLRSSLYVGGPMHQHCLAYGPQGEVAQINFARASVQEHKASGTIPSR